MDVVMVMVMGVVMVMAAAAVVAEAAAIRVTAPGERLSLQPAIYLLVCQTFLTLVLHLYSLYNPTKSAIQMQGEINRAVAKIKHQERFALFLYFSEKYGHSTCGSWHWKMLLEWTC